MSDIQCEDCVYNNVTFCGYYHAPLLRDTLEFCTAHDTGEME